MIDYNRDVVLGPVEEKDLETLRAWRNNYAIWKTCRQNDLIDGPSQKRWFERVSLDPTIKMYQVYHRYMDGPMGVCGLTSIDLSNRRAEFSLYIAPEFQGTGLGRAALETLLCHGFNSLGLHCIWGETFEGNPAIKMFDAIGFTREGLRRDFYFKEGKFINAILVSILSTDKEWT